MPKPLLEVDDVPVVRHVMQIYAMQGFTRFVLAAGFKSDLVREFAGGLPAEWTVDVVDTGEDTDKADRIVMCRELLTPTFFATYSDGVGNVDLDELLRFHRAHAGCATATVVPLPSQYGTLEFGDDGGVHSFLEKPVLRDHWINAGFFVFDEQAFDHWKGADLEGEVLPALGAENQLYAYRHRGFWKSMDTFKDGLELTELARAAADDDDGRPPWFRSQTRASS
jgi:glucose-1-phosphate cytidylyltransferase